MSSKERKFLIHWRIIFWGPLFGLASESVWALPKISELKRLPEYVGTARILRSQRTSRELSQFAGIRGDRPLAQIGASSVSPRPLSIEYARWRSGGRPQSWIVASEDYGDSGIRHVWIPTQDVAFLSFKEWVGSADVHMVPSVHLPQSSSQGANRLVSKSGSFRIQTGTYRTQHRTDGLLEESMNLSPGPSLHHLKLVAVNAQEHFRVYKLALPEGEVHMLKVQEPDRLMEVLPFQQDLDGSHQTALLFITTDGRVAKFFKSENLRTRNDWTSDPSVDGWKLDFRFHPGVERKLLETWSSTPSNR